MNSNVAPFRSQGVIKFWIDGFREPITGTIEDIQFLDTETGIDAIIIINDGTMKYHANMKAITVWGESVNQERGQAA